MANKIIEEINGQEFDLQFVRQKLANKIAEAYRNEERVLIESLPITGKTYSTFEQASKTDTQILYLTSLNRLKYNAVERCQDEGLSHHLIPTPHSDCPSFQKENDEVLASDLRHLYERGISGKELHDHRDLLCANDCPYLQERTKDISDIDVLIGNPKHSYRDEYFQGRIVVKDEFSEEEFEITYESAREIIDRFTQTVKTFPLDSYDEILGQRDKEKGAEALNWFKNFDVYRDSKTALKPEKYHVHAPALTYALLVGDIGKFDNGWERTEIGLTGLFDIDTEGLTDNAQIVRDPKSGKMYLLNPPEFEKANGFIGLDGTPHKDMWETATGVDLDHRKLMDLKEKQRYITDVLNLNIIDLSGGSPRYYHNSENIAIPKDTNHAYSIWQEEGEKPGFITSKKGISVYEDKDSEIFEFIDEYMTFKEVLSSNKFKNKQIGFVSGMRGYSGDEYIKKWGAYQDESVEVIRKENADTIYKFGNTEFNIFPYFRKLTLQDVFRFGRNEEPTTVYVDTSALPEWIPTKEKNLTTYGKVERKMISVLEDNKGRPLSVKQISELIDIPERTVRYYSKRITVFDNINKLDDRTPQKYIYQIQHSQEVLKSTPRLLRERNIDIN